MTCFFVDIGLINCRKLLQEKLLEPARICASDLALQEKYNAVSNANSNASINPSSNLSSNPNGGADGKSRSNGSIKVAEVGAKDDSLESAERARRDEMLVERARNGEREAFKQLVEQYQSRAHAVALGVVGNYQDAEDVVQDAFVKAYRNLGSFRGQSSFYTWLYRIVFNLAIDLSRRAYRKNEHSVEHAAGLDSAARTSASDAGSYLGKVADPEEERRNAEIRLRFSQALASLSPEHRAVIILREIDGLSYSEISDVIGCSKGTVMSRLHHARKRLQAALKDLMPDGFTGRRGETQSSRADTAAAENVVDPGEEAENERAATFFKG